MATDEKSLIPKFNSEAEESDWWDAHPEVVTELVQRAVKAGAIRHGPLQTVTVPYIKMPLEEALDRQHQVNR